MKVRYLRPVLSIALACWFGFLACLLGCAEPAFAIPLCESAQTPSGHLAPANGETGDRPCCNHGRNSSGGPHRNQHKDASCCPLDATLTQRQDSGRPANAAAHVAVLPFITLPSPNAFVTSSELPLPTIWRAGRDLLLQAHVLRI